MPTKTATKPARDPGLMIRVPLVVLAKLRERAEEVPRGPLQSEAELLYALAQRALAIGADSGRLVPKE